MADFYSRFNDYTKEYESPGSFWRWASYICVAGVLRNNVYFQYKSSKTFLNIYVLELADSAGDRKGQPLYLAEKLLRKINTTKIIAGRSSIQAVLEDLGRAETDKKGVVKTGGSGVYFAQELSSAIVEDPAAVKILTDIYDSRSDYDVNLKSGKAKIEDLCFSLHAASNEELLKGIYGSDAVYGGLLGRTFLVKPDEFRPSNSLMGDEESGAAARETLAFEEMEAELRRISELKGRMLFTPEARKAYTSWYEPFRNSQRSRSDKSGIVGRFHTGVLKMSMIIHAGRHVNTIVTKESFEEALAQCTELLPNYQSYIMSAGKSDLANAGQIVLTALYKAEGHKLSRTEILQEHWTDVDSEMLDKLMKTLEEAGMISTTVSYASIVYKMSDKAVKMMEGEK